MGPLTLVQLRARDLRRHELREHAERPDVPLPERPSPRRVQPQDPDQVILVHERRAHRVPGQVALLQSRGERGLAFGRDHHRVAAGGHAALESLADRRRGPERGAGAPGHDASKDAGADL